MNDLKPFKHDEGSHWCCNNRLLKEGGKATCCTCNPHDNCGDDEPMNRYEEYDEEFKKQWADYLKSPLRGDSDDEPDRDKILNFLHSCLDQERKKILELLDKRMPLEVDERKTRNTGNFIIESYDEKQGYNAAIRQINIIIQSLR